MLELKDISKIYEIGKKNDKEYQQVEALKNVSLKFRESEFVSILGPSGCGKTTLLNIIGGLDKYTSGDLVINGKSTKEFTDRDWDTYRNHSVGFVFQSYNLIPHQTVLQNVEIALTLSGIKKEERKSRAVEVLKRVGLEDKINAKPNQLSGGQMQRVAIARALVNNPDVILADEPTGALDSKTSVQIMDLLKEISKEKLIIMVTHNPELAETYSTRIIRLSDGELVSDSMPVQDNEEFKNRENRTTHKSMSFWSALSLSFKNLLTKKARTILVSFAGSIGIIGIALILALSSGFQGYINKVQEDTLSNYPLTIQAKSMDLTSTMMSLFMPSGESVENPDDGHVYSADTMTNLFDSFAKTMKENDLKSFKAYIEEHYSELEPYVNDVQYTYNFAFEAKQLDGANVDPGSTSLYDMMIDYSSKYLEHNAKVTVTKQADGSFKIKATDNTNYNFITNYLSQSATTVLQSGQELPLTEDQVVEIIAELVGMDKQVIQAYNTPYVSYGIFSEMIGNQELIESQYELVGAGSKWATEANEVILVLGDNNDIDDYILYSLGLITKEQIDQTIASSFSDTKPTHKVNYNDIIGKEYKILMKNDYYLSDGTNYTYMKDPLTGYLLEEYKDEYNALISNDSIGAKVKIVGICRLKEDVENGCLSSGIGYTEKFTTQMISYYNNSDVVKSGTIDEISLTPVAVSIYSKSFESKQSVIAFIDNYNAQVEEDQKIEYTDTVGLLMDSISTIISAISYVLIGFVSVSLVVSSIMIGIITYISVLERIKEIGILRAVGASKKDIKRVFTAETFIIGLVSGVLGILITLLLTIPVNLIIGALTGISGVAKLPVVSAFILIGISMLLTIIAGLIPAKIASKKDPVIALRSE